MAYPVCAIIYADVRDSTRSHGLDQDALQQAIVLNPRAGQTDVAIINLGDVAPRVYFPSEPEPDSALPHQIRDWAKKLRSAVDRTQQGLENLRSLAYAGKCSAYSDAWDDPEIRRLAAAAAEARELAKLLAHVGRSRGMQVDLLDTLTVQPILILDSNQTTPAIRIADAIVADA